MKKTVLTFILSLLVTYSVQAQKIKFGALQQIGICGTEDGLGLNFSVTNGIRFKKFFTGIAADIKLISQTGISTTALFLDGRYYINKKQNFFAKADAGVNLITFGMQSDRYYSYKKKPGAYAGIGIGYKAKLGNEVFYTFDLNYCLRQTIYSSTYFNHWSRQTQSDKLDFRQFALVLNMGLEI